MPRKPPKGKSLAEFNPKLAQKELQNEKGLDKYIDDIN
tara:strand:- start:286 stop:399 length:114 start_codon:yes stop_codon:yes gene_type:complete